MSIFFKLFLLLITPSAIFFIPRSLISIHFLQFIFLIFPLSNFSSFYVYDFLRFSFLFFPPDHNLVSKIDAAKTIHVLRESIDIARFQEMRARIQRISQMQFSRKKARSNGF